MSSPFLLNPIEERDQYEAASAPLSAASIGKMGKDLKEEMPSSSSSRIQVASSSSVRCHDASSSSSSSSSLQKNGRSPLSKKKKNHIKTRGRHEKETCLTDGDDSQGDEEGPELLHLIPPAPSFFEEKKWRGFSRREIVRLLLQCMKELGY
ncbi:hypothetical protein CSUI_010576, partial [Cystoisospora suis]